MTIAQLKKILELFDDEKDVFVFCPEHSTVYDIETCSDNNGHLQLNVL